MAGRIVMFRDGAHRRSELLLPWLVNGTLDDDERATVEQHMRECRRCQRELKLLRAVQAVYGDDAALPLEATAFAQLKMRIESAQQKNLKLRKLAHLWREAPQWARGLLAAQCAILVLLGGVMLAGQQFQPLYHTLGSTEAAATRGDIVVVFAPQTREADLQRIVRSVSARVVDGPNAAHAYVLALPRGATVPALAALRAEPAVVLAERLDTEQAR